MVVPALAAVLAASAPAPADTLRLDRTRPDHLGPKTPDSIEPPAPAEHLYRKIDVLAYRLPQSLDKLAKLDAKLSHLCRLGAFGQQRSNALYATSPNGSFGVAFAEGANLHDPQSLAKPGSVYFFSYRETSNCEVFKTQRNQLQSYSTTVFGSPPQAAAPAR